MMNKHFSIIWGTRQIRNQQLSLYLACAIKQIKGMGIKAFDRIAVCDENSVEYVILLLALWQIKAIAAPISPRWPDKTIASYVAKINARHLFRGVDIKRAVCFDARQQIEAEGIGKDLDLGQEVTIIATSGSSGEVKAAVHTWGNHFYSAQGSNKIIPLTSSDRWLLSLPLYHISGLAIAARCLLSGAGLVIAADDLIGAIQRGRATHVSLVGTQLQRLLDDGKNLPLLRSLKVILLGGSAIPQTLIEKSAKLGLNLYLSYGLTEMSSQVATGKVIENSQACVKALPYRQIKVSPEGEILVKGEVLFKGYVTGTRLSLPLSQDFWFSTGDIGQLDKRGCLTVSGRRDSMFISGGENIHPEEIEKALLSIKGIIEATVVPKEDKEFGQRPIAFIKFAGEPLEEEDIIRYLQAVLPRFKIPIAFFPWPHNLMNQGLKISRQEFLKTLPRR